MTEKHNQRSYCEVCGSEVRAEANFCPSCGSPQKAGLQVPRDPDVPPPGEGRIETQQMNASPLPLTTPTDKKGKKKVRCGE
ncbi:MAG: zinc ribbon domain-containing protein [Rubrobacter sp.]|nr:zinc ribbon domain-containing protein [Rubrobacter sp.]